MTRLTAKKDEIISAEKRKVRVSVIMVRNALLLVRHGVYSAAGIF